MMVRFRLHVPIVVTCRLRAMGIRDKPTAPASPCQNGFAERLIGSIGRECVDHIIVLGEMHLRRILKSYADYYNSVRTHRSLQGCAGFSPGSANRCDQFTRHPGRTSPPLRPSLSFRYTQVFAGLYRLAPGVLDALKIVRPETVIRWHRAGFRAYWRWKSRLRSGRPKTPLEIRHLIRKMSLANPLWGAPRIHGELLKLDINVGQTTVAKYMARGRRPPSQGWKTFLHNHADGIASIDLFVVPTISFRLLYGLLILHHGRRQILWLGVTAHPTAEWISHQLTEAYGWKVAPRYIIRDRDALYGDVFIRRLRAMSIRDRPTAPRSPWQNGYCERAIGSSRRECLDHVVVFGERHLRHLLRRIGL